MSGIEFDFSSIFAMLWSMTSFWTVSTMLVGISAAGWFAFQSGVRRRRALASKIAALPVLSPACFKAVHAHVAECMKDNDPSHNIAHVARVYHYSMRMAHELLESTKTLDLQVVQLGALLHDIFDYKYAKVSEVETATTAPVGSGGDSRDDKKTSALGTSTTTSPALLLTEAVKSATVSVNSVIADLDRASLIAHTKATPPMTTPSKTDVKETDPLVTEAGVVKQMTSLLDRLPLDSLRRLAKGSNISYANVQKAALIKQLVQLELSVANNTESATMKARPTTRAELIEYLTPLLRPHGITDTQIDGVAVILLSISFNTSLDAQAPPSKDGSLPGHNVMPTLEAMIVQRADRLDAMGCIGIMRAFQYGGFKKRPGFDGRIRPMVFSTSAEYKQKSAQSTTLNHFPEKLLKLIQAWYIPSSSVGLELAQTRQDRMCTFFNEFLMEMHEAGEPNIDHYCTDRQVLDVN